MNSILMQGLKPLRFLTESTPGSVFSRLASGFRAFPEPPAPGVPATHSYPSTSIPFCRCPRPQRFEQSPQPRYWNPRVEKALPCSWTPPYCVQSAPRLLPVDPRTHCLVPLRPLPRFQRSHVAPSVHWRPGALP
ncbi:uncharacterized protein ANIA_10774 [Aspergillus nidulans FGSC A4]|uniref:Uncharacterized protein n=1 Tax=Emericella nidulans (strain FGSC A4 / ATCC 38163 / CBS 112.46 / NRRL 194 / M139) TaxID=227321 RepID=C8V2V7_EMENI|nr:hypothetical protein [Aspergillus nidulans FGSC A4]CBF70296.1 TPA: conserved hypothetical protein [Aspergillus nidulans FGSC A4]